MAVPITNLDITVVTSEDNLRDDSSATAWILIIDGKETKEYSTGIKTETEPEWKNNSTHGPIGWNVPSGITDENHLALWHPYAVA